VTREVAGIRAALRRWPDQPFCCNEGVEARLAAVLEEQRASPNPSIGPDIQVLVRQVFYKEWLCGGERGVEVPLGGGWPEASQWSHHGFEARSSADGTCWLEVQPWTPQWLEGGALDPFAGSTREEQRRHYHKTPTDPFVRDVTGFETYTSYAQRDAVRGFILSEPGAVVLVTLPTGSGKSLLAYLPALMGPSEGHFTLVVVPTVALAIDQEAQYRELAGALDGRQRRRLAWHSGLSEADKSSILSDMEAGRQRILFTSPEAVCGPLAPVLSRLNSRGYLANFVVDEVHLLAQWGDEFRPEFQQVVGIWRGLRSQAPVQSRFKTLLMTATVTDGVVDTLDTLFRHEVPIHAIAGVGLRPEPEYWFQKARSQDERRDWLLDAIAHAPRPLILYVTEVASCKRWRKRLKDQGYRRVEAFHGDTPSGEREKIIDEWRSDRLDIVVATSAFGVGIDKGNIRTVLHACVPETIDRYYQEVGRGGRDGLASTSVVLWVKRDLEVAHGLALQKTITADKGLPRWEAMLATGREQGNSIEIDLDAVPEHMHAQNDASRLWNLRTIVLLARARFLEIGPPPPAIRAGSDAHEQAPRRTPITVRVLEPDHRAAEAWDTRVESYRERSLSYYSGLFNKMRDVLQGGIEVSQTLASAYALNRPWFSYVSLACAGCPQCRRSKSTRMSNQIYATHTPSLHKYELQKWTELFPEMSPAMHYVVFREQGMYCNPAGVANLVARAIATLDIRELGFVGGWAQESLDLAQKVYDLTAKRPFAVNWDPAQRTTYGDYSDSSKITCLHDLGSRPVPMEVYGECRALHLVLVPEGALDPVRKNLRIIDVNTNWSWAGDFGRALG
jgi:ATP-dependent DNA helicase RecQ